MGEKGCLSNLNNFYVAVPSGARGGEAELESLEGFGLDPNCNKKSLQALVKGSDTIRFAF